MEHFVTICDYKFLPQLLNLYRSFEKTIDEFILHVVCVNRATFEFVGNLPLKSINPINLTDFEDETLLRLKEERSAREYFWTLTPQLPTFVIKAYGKIERITYLDADLFFYRSPKIIINRFLKTNKNMLITDHAFATHFDQSHHSGKFCVQFITFRFPDAEPIRKEWADLCIDWCYDKSEPGRYGDQKYLERLEQKYPDDIHVLEQKEFCQAPWNHLRFSYSDAIFNHFQGLRIVSERVIEFADYPIPKYTYDFIYIPYIQELRRTVEFLTMHGFIFEPQAKPTSLSLRLWRSMRNVKRLACDLNVRQFSKF